QTAGLASGEAFPIGTTTNTFVITDASGNSNTCSFTVTVNDTEAPVLMCPGDITLDNDLGQCGAQVVYNVSGSDNCPNETLTQTGGLPSGSFFPVGTTTVSYELADASGNTVSCSFNVTVNDTETPSLSCPSNIVTVNDTGLCSAVVDYTVTSGDNCPGATVVQTSGLASGAAFPIGTTTNTFVITDASGNSISCSFDVLVNDAEAPTISCPADIVTSNDAGACSAVVNYNVTGSDNCPGTTITQTSGLASGSTFPVGITTNTFQITDAAGNTATCSFNVTVNDSESPVIACPADINVGNDPGQCGAVVSYAVTGADNCPGVSITQTSGLASGSLFPIGVTINTFTITDASGNSQTCSFEVKVDDTEVPVIVCPADIITGNDPGSCDAIVTYSLTTSDNCPGATIVQIDGLPSGAQFPIGDTMNKFEITDAAGNSTICNFLVTVEDTESPIPSASLPDIIAQCEATVLPPIAPDNCKGDVTGTTSDPTTYTAQGTYVITWLYDDGSGNTSTQTQNVIIQDTTAPETPLLNPIVGQCFAAVPTPTTIDNCAGVVAGATTDPTNYTAQGTYIVNWTFDDGNGNIITVPQTVTIDDTSNPVPDVTNLPTLTAECSLDITTIPTATDNCLGAINATTTDPLTYTDQGTFTITWTYDDGNGNAVSQTQTVIIDDVTAPDAVVLADVIEQCSATVTAPTTTDNCAGVVTGTTSDPLVYTTQGNYLITWNFDDGNGNSFNATQNVIVNDTEAPIPDNASLSNVTGDCEATVTAVPTATDNCEGQILGTTTDPLVYTTQGIFTITWTYDDGNGNVSTQTQTVVVEDTVDPVLSNCPTNISLCGAQAVNWTPPTASDNCDFTLTSTHEPGDLFDLGTTTVVYTATDSAGNTATCSFDVTINANPIITIVESPLDDFCQGIGELTVVIANESELQLPIDITWSTGSNDESIIVNDNNTYTVTVSSGNGCSATASYASTTSPQDVLSGHVMIGKRGVRLFGSRVFGNVGVTDNNRTAQVRAFSQVYGFVRSDNIFTDWFSYVQTPIYSDSDVTLPTFYNNTTPNNCGDDITVQPYTTVTLDEELYDNVYVRYGATLIIDSPEVYINRLTTESGVTIIFNQPSAVMVDKQMRIGRYNTIDRNGNAAIFYVEKDVTIDRSADIDVNIYSKRSIKVRRSSFFYRTTMRGLFIALKNVESSFFVDWYPSSGCAATPIPDGPSPCNSLVVIDDDDDDDDDDEFEADRVTLFPVPARDVLNVTFESPTTTKASYIVASMRGEVSIQSAWDVEKGHNEEKVDVTRLSDGIYSIIINLNGETISKQFVVKRGK
ncbi:MAG: HYR domain-containing protein, partial [Psychroserpens sp.]|nr:HYR domain-containing protein [Psychroserpens sp.]